MRALCPLAFLLWSLVGCAALHAEDGYELWLRYRLEPVESRRADYTRALGGGVVAPDRPILRAARAELERALPAMLGHPLAAAAGAGQILLGQRTDHPALAALVSAAELTALGDEGFVLRSGSDEGRPVLVVASAHDRGVLHGVFALLRRLQLGEPAAPVSFADRPLIRERIANHWDNPYRAPGFRNESIERGYAGETIFKWDELPGTIDPRLHDWARLLAAMGLNGVCVNNVNTAKRGLEGWRLLTTPYLPKVAALADVLRPYGVRLYLSVNFFSPILLDRLETADPLDPRVQQWWRDKAAEIYAVIPDFGGFIVKADSEGEPGPLKYGRTHSDGANMIAAALAPHGGTVHWRAFVYDREKGDRVVQAAAKFRPLDGQFAANSFLQIKNGPLDFQVREPVSTLLGAMPATHQLLELQITQEYTGQDKHVCFLAPMWREVLQFDTHARGPGSTIARLLRDDLHPGTRHGLVGVMNTGDDRNWTGHLLAQANTYAFGRLAWNPDVTPEEIARDWVRLTFGRDERVVAAVTRILLDSWPAHESYTAPFGLGLLTRRADHFVPDPIDRADYHGADRDGVGFDRTSATGTGYTVQYFPPWRALYESRATCPEDLLLMFHHVPWTHRMKSGETLIQALYDRYYAGAARARGFVAEWKSLEGLIDDERHRHVLARLEQQAELADGWVGTMVGYWLQRSEIPDEKNRLLPQPHPRTYVAP